MAQSREDHLTWCKARAEEYLKTGDARNAWASFSSDMLKHPETREHEALRLGVMLMIGGSLATVDQVRDFIGGFN